MTKPVLISFSGGRSSGYMTWLLYNHPKYADRKKICMYANVGREREETLQFIKDCDDHFDFRTLWIEAVISQERGVGVQPSLTTFEAAIRIGQHGPFDDLIKKLGIPNPAKAGHCTRDLKIRPMEKFMKMMGHKEFDTAIGIRPDEPKRVTSRSDVLYPLVDLGIDEEAVRKWWLQQPFDLQLKDYQANCELCFKKSERKILTCMSENPDEWSQWWEDHEEADEHGWRFARSKTPIKELRERARVGDFNPAVDRFAHLYEESNGIH